MIDGKAKETEIWNLEIPPMMTVVLVMRVKALSISLQIVGVGEGAGSCRPSFLFSLYGSGEGVCQGKGTQVAKDIRRLRYKI